MHWICGPGNYGSFIEVKLGEARKPPQIELVSMCILQSINICFCWYKDTEKEARYFNKLVFSFGYIFSFLQFILCHLSSAIKFL
jgi:hypothetical protein